MGVPLDHRHGLMAADALDGRKVYSCLHQMRDSGVAERVADDLFGVEAGGGHRAHERLADIDRVPLQRADRRKQPGRALRQSVNVVEEERRQVGRDRLRTRSRFRGGDIDRPRTKVDVFATNTQDF